MVDTAIRSAGARHNMAIGAFIGWFFTIILLANRVDCDGEAKLSYHYDRMDTVNGTGEYFKYDFSIAKQDGSDTVFVVQANIEQLVDLDDEWKSDITVYRSDSADGEFTKFLKFPKVGVCMFLKTVYKKYFYEKIKDYSNMPHYEKCPLTKETYWVKDYPFDASQFKGIAKPGFYRAEAFLVQGDVAKTGVFVYGSVTEQ